MSSPYMFQGDFAYYEGLKERQKDHEDIIPIHLVSFLRILCGKITRLKTNYTNQKDISDDTWRWGLGLQLTCDCHFVILLWFSIKLKIPRYRHGSQRGSVKDILVVYIIYSCGKIVIIEKVTEKYLKNEAAMILRIGFVLMQIGSIPVENIYKIIYHNVVDIAVAMVSFSTLGILFSFGSKSTGAIAYWDDWNKATDFSGNAAGFAAVLIGSAEMSTFLVGRIHMGGSILATVLYCTFYQPMLMHWVWDKDGWISKLAKDDINRYVSDHGGALVVHVPSTIMGLVGALFLGRRLVRVKDVDEISFSNENALCTVVGHLLAVLGYIGLALPWNHGKVPVCGISTYCCSLVLINAMLAVGTGIAILTVLYLIAYPTILKYWIVLRITQGGVAGFMMISAGINTFSPNWSIYLLALIGAVIFFFCSLVLHNTALEDSCNLTSSHLICGLVGALLCPLFESRKSSSPIWAGRHALWQFVWILIIVICTVVFAVIVFSLLNACKILRSQQEIEDHQRALNVHDNLPENKKHLERLLMIDDVRTPHILPGNYRKRFVPESGDGAKNTVFQEIPVGERSKNKKLAMGVKKDDDYAMPDDATLLFPIVYPKHQKDWSELASGDYYDTFISNMLLSRPFVFKLVKD
ncbi:hypothetical protein NQ317_001480 [Molorchus minor]|uniref:Ammonium transporter AmtB-like domain-containing protein n=1 Tax=Molorchus minor TaxID=1323400 RepID=A0ABQ9JUU1_9CUCU|nr:hypothetical protein NQ317_001480 [Molorchus minor]